MEHSVICEPVEVSPELLVKAEHIRREEGSDPVGPFHHFHDACELIWYRKASGELISGAGTFEFGNQTAVFVPAMQSHDFRISAGEKEWFILHVDPALISTLGEHASQAQLGEILCCTLNAPQAQRIDTLFEWATELAADASAHRQTLTAIIDLILLELGKASRTLPTELKDVSEKLERLRPALDLVAQDTSGPLSLEQAASVCHLSPAYFSRRFKLVFGMNFSEYARLYRLRLAARRLISGGERVADIAFSLGFATPAHFTAIFQKRYDMTPREFRKYAREHAENTP